MVLPEIPKNPWFYAVGNFDLSTYLACCCGILKDRRVVMALLVTCKCVVVVWDNLLLFLR